MDYQLLFPGRFLKSVEFKGQDVTLTIASIAIEELVGTKTETKGIIHFRETKKQLVLNRTNAECIKAMFGRETDKWVGKRVTLYPEAYQDHTGGDATTAIRVRGSPDIAGTTSAVIALARKKPFTKTLIKTGPKSNGKAPTPAEEPPPSGDAMYPGVEP